MLWIWVILLVIVCMLLYILFAPFYLEINSIQDIYRIRFHKLASARLIITGDSLKIDMRVAGWNKQFDLLARSGKTKTEQKEKKGIEYKRKRPRVSLSKVKAVIRSFTVKECHLVIDSGDVQLNGILFPVFYLLGKRYHKHMEINFLDKNILVLVVENNFAKMIRAFIFY